MISVASSAVPTGTATGMATARARLSRAASPLAIGVLAFLTSLIALDVPSVWYDEVATISAATRSWPQLVTMLGTIDAVHGLYYAGMHVVFDLLGYSPFSLRLPSAVAVGLAASLVVVLGRQLGGRRLGVLAGLAFCLLPRVTWMAVEGRSSAVTAALAVLLTVVLVQALRTSSRRWWVLYSALAVLCCFTFLYLGLVVVAHGIAVLLMRYPLRRWLLAAGAAGLFVAPFALIVMSQSRQLPATKPPGLHTLGEVLVAQWFVGSVPFAVAGLALVVFGLGRLRLPSSASATIIPLLLVPTLGLLAVALASPATYQPRYLAMCTPFLAVGIGMGLARLRTRVAIAAALVVLLAIAVPEVIAQRSPEAKKDPTWSQVAELITRERAQDGPDSTAAILYGAVTPHHSATARVIAYAYPAAFRGTLDPTLGIPAAQTRGLWETQVPLADSLTRLASADVVYAITTEGAARQATRDATLRASGWLRLESWQRGPVAVIRYVRG